MAWEQRERERRGESEERVIKDKMALTLQHSTFYPSDCLASILALILLTSPVTNSQDKFGSEATVKQLYNLLQQRASWSELIKHNDMALPALSSGHCLVRKTFIIMPTAAVFPLALAQLKVMAINNLTDCLTYKKRQTEKYGQLMCFWLVLTKWQEWSDQVEIWLENIDKNKIIQWTCTVTNTIVWLTWILYSYRTVTGLCGQVLVSNAVVLRLCGPLWNPSKYGAHTHRMRSHPSWSGFHAASIFSGAVPLFLLISCTPLQYLCLNIGVWIL